MLDVGMPNVNVFNEGVMWEKNPFRIETDHECSSYGGTPCRHSRERHEIEGSDEYRWIQPAVIIVRNEGGHNSTGVCLDCVLEAAKTIVRGTGARL
jgi:hypothetical protein